MKNTFSVNVKHYGAMLALVGISMFSCQKDILETGTIQDEDATIARATYDSRTVNFTHSNGTYSQSMAASDFGNVSKWNESHAYISSNTCRIKLIKNTLGGDGGLSCNIDVPDGSEYELTYNVKFHSDFDWSRGGKLGFGIIIGDDANGCDPATGRGADMRIMWYQNDSHDVYFRPYAYYKDQADDCGDSFNKRYPSSGSLSKGTWYTVYMRVKSNSGSNVNGYLELKINGTTLVSKSIRWTTDDSKRLINRLNFNNFRGGSTSNWMSDTDGYIYYDFVSWKKLAN